MKMVACAVLTLLLAGVVVPMDRLNQEKYALSAALTANNTQQSCGICKAPMDDIPFGLACHDKIDYFHLICLRNNLEAQSPHYFCVCPTCKRVILAEEFTEIFSC